MMPSSAPTTHAAWKRVSKRANARPRTASGPSRCSRLSKARRPAEALTPIAKAAIARPTFEPISVPSSAAAAQVSRATTSIHSSRRCSRSRGAKKLPAKLPAPEAPITKKNPSTWLLRVKAAKKITNPTAPRSNAIAEPASRIDG